MRKLRSILFLIGIGSFCPGCIVFRDAARTSVVEPLAYPTHFEHAALCAHTNKLGEKAWTELHGDTQKHHDDYHKGFVAGYADYLQFGGSGEPPAMPPRCYWAQETVEGRQKAVEWFAGFREGSGVARQSGIREHLILVPASASIHVRESNNSNYAGSAIPVVTNVPDPTVLPDPRLIESTPMLPRVLPR